MTPLRTLCAVLHNVPFTRAPPTRWFKWPVRRRCHPGITSIEARDKGDKQSMDQFTAFWPRSRISRRAAFPSATGTIRSHHRKYAGARNCGKPIRYRVTGDHRFKLTLDWWAGAPKNALSTCHSLHAPCRYVHSRLRCPSTVPARTCRSSSGAPATRGPHRASPARRAAAGHPPR